MLFLRAALRAGNALADSVNLGSDVVQITRATDRVAAGMDIATTPLQAARRGTELHVSVGDTVGSSLDAFTSYSHGANRATGIQPDFVAPGVWADITTPRQWQRHVDLYSQTHGQGIPILYELGVGVVDTPRLHSLAGATLTLGQKTLGSPVRPAK